MKAKTKKRFQQALFYFIIVVFVAGLLLAYLPVTSTSPVTPTAPPLEQNPEALNDAPATSVTAAPAR